MISAKNEVTTASRVVRPMSLELAPSGARLAESSTGSATQGSTLNECFSSQPSRVASITARMTRMNSISVLSRGPDRRAPPAAARFAG